MIVLLLLLLLLLPLKLLLLELTALFYISIKLLERNVALGKLTYHYNVVVVAAVVVVVFVVAACPNKVWKVLSIRNQSSYRRQSQRHLRRRVFG